MKLPVKAEKVLPHRGRMLLIDTVTSAEDGAGTVTTRLPANSISRTADGRIFAPFYIELVAQAYAAICGYSFLSRDIPVPEGYLVGVQKFEIHQNPPADCPFESQLIISVQTLGSFDGFAVVEGVVSCDSKVIAEGKIKVFVPEDAATESRINESTVALSGASESKTQ
ncbi:3-hydroxylacyl-ACP dehydratase [Maridesulfovibrio hydrothermalis]|uniref:3-hydroxylacyl-(Acyl carrier protein) dehydratase n=1 Tax=Maridesulfovibrio hydrothermalis AM13 = DSM 14728 TaxID=1121451 RepID=L0R9L7_9BACT|nr:3-hydroxylacyl-ACP dehydratase [Maridesulfovibrio hydrothermalis]CCO23429.1 3-hydroxylacyl-(Acyl carrier protein) dehydratase [Maridesulfovibrio hydrothermalis AM13 = DSM 14728]